MEQNQDALVYVGQDQPKVSTLVVLLMLVWGILGVLGFFFSLVCFSYSGSFMQNWVGFLTAIVLGPFYWIYYAFAGPSYCSSGKKQQQQQLRRFQTKKSKKGKKSRK